MQRDSALSLFKVLKFAKQPVRVVTSNYIPELDRRLMDAQIEREHSLNMYDFFQNAVEAPERSFTLQDLRLPFEPVQVFPQRKIELFDDTKLVGRITPYEQTPVGKMRPQFLDLLDDAGEINWRYVFDWRGFLSSKIKYIPAKPHAKMKKQDFYSPLGEHVLQREYADSGLPENFTLDSGQLNFVHEQDLFNYFVSLIQDDNVTANIFTQYAPAAYTANAKLAPTAQNIYLYQAQVGSEYTAKEQLNYVTTQHDNIVAVNINQIPTFIDQERHSIAMQDETSILIIDWYKDIPQQVENLLITTLTQIDQEFNIKLYLTGPYTDLMVYSAGFTGKLRAAGLDFTFAIENEAVKFQEWFTKSRLLISLTENLNQKILQEALAVRLPVVQLSEQPLPLEAAVPEQIQVLATDATALLEQLRALLDNLNLWSHYHVEMDKLARKYRINTVTSVWNKLLSGDDKDEN